MSLLKIDNPLALRLLMTDDLYSVKVQPKESPAVIESSPPQAVNFNYQGENNKYILILVDDPIHTIINPADLATLNTILAAKKLELRDVAIVNFNKHSQSNFSQMKEFFSFSKLVLFGINPKSIGIPHISNNEIIPYEGSKVLATYTFKEMHNDISKKRLFWNEMKKL